MRITKKGSGQELEAAVDPVLGGYYRITENCSYIVETEGEELGHPALTRLKAGVYELFFSNFVGWTKIGDTLIKIRTPKLVGNEFDNMLKQITEVFASLPFDFNTPSFLPFERIAAGTEEVLYHAFLYLRYVVRDAEPSLGAIIERIVANPHRMMVQEEEKRELHRARRVGASSVNRLARSPRDLVDTRNAPHLNGYEIAQRLESVSGRRYFPTRVHCVRKEATVDNPENRFVKYFLTNCLNIAELFRLYLVESVKSGKEIDYGLVVDAGSIAGTIEELLAHRFFGELGDMLHLPYNSQVLQKGPGYRELFGHFNRMNLGSTYPIGSADLKKVIESKDVALLYEYWTFFICVDTLSRILGTPCGMSIGGGKLKAELRQPMCTVFDGGVSLHYNKTYQGNGKGSYSLPYRPDISLETPDGIYIFDAKFKKDKVIYEQFEGERPAETQEEEYGQGFKYGDINKMHCYRDAIDGVRAAFILYPGDRFRFFHKEEGKVSSPLAVRSFDGVGAIPLKPPAEKRGEASGTDILEVVFRTILNV